MFNKISRYTETPAKAGVYGFQPSLEFRFFQFSSLKKLLLLSFGIIFSLASQALAQDNSNGFITKLDTVTVVATKTSQSTFSVPGMVDVISLEDNAINGAATTLSDVFINTPSVQMQGTSRRNGQAPNIRGLSQNSTLVLLDGVRQNFQSRHDGRMFVEPSLLKQVEIVRGASSSLYGSGAMGGVIAMETIKATDMLSDGKTTGADVSFGFDSVNNNMTETAKAYGRYGDVDILGALTKANSGNIDLSDGQELHSNDDLYSGIVNAEWFLGDKDMVSFGYNGYHMDSEEPNNPQMGLDDTQGDDYVNKTVQNHSFHLQYDFDDVGHDLLNNFSAKLYFNNTQVNEVVLVDTSLNNVGDKLERHLNTLGINLDNQTNLDSLNGFGKHILSYGAEYYVDTQKGSDSGEADGENGGVPDAESETFGMYLQNEVMFSDLGSIIPGRLSVIPGVRLDAYSSSDEAGNAQDKVKLSPKLATSYQPNDWLMVFGSYAQAFRAPNLTELYSSGTHFPFPPFGNNVFVPNPNLKPETTKTFEIGAGVEFGNVLQDKDKVRLKGSRYWTKADNFIDLDINIMGLTSTNVNIPNAELNGVDIEAGYDTLRWGATVGYSDVTGRNQDTGAYITTISPPSVTTSIEFKMPEQGAVVGLQSRFATEHDEVNTTAERRRGFGVHGIYASWQPKDVSSLTVKAGVDNVFDKKYETVFAGSPEEGRNFRINLNWKF